MNYTITNTQKQAINQILTLLKRKFVRNACAFSMVLFITTMNAGAQRYEAPVYNTPGHSCTVGYGRINSLNISGIDGAELNDVPPCSPDYKNRTLSIPALELAAGSTFYGSIGISVPGTQYNIWIDFNNDGTFAASERVAVGYPENNYVSSHFGEAPFYDLVYPLTISIPSDVTAGIHRMRVRTSYTGGNRTVGMLDPCANTNGTDINYYGSAADYLVKVNAGAACGPEFTSLAAHSNVSPGDSTSFSVATNGASTYQWQVNSGSGFSDLADTGIYSGATTATLSVTGVTYDMTSYQYRCIAAYGSFSSTSNSAALLVKEVIINNQPSDHTAQAAGSSADEGFTSYKTEIVAAP
jgi:hypothetical protein